MSLHGRARASMHGFALHLYTAYTANILYTLYKYYVHISIAALPVMISMRMHANQVLGIAARLAAASRQNFRAERLHGLGEGGVRKLVRSHEMLRPAAASQRGPASKF